jgi:hypothetical protein
MMDAKTWTLAFDETRQESFDALVELKFQEVIILQPGEMVEMYVHAENAHGASDRGLVYDNSLGFLGLPESDGTLDIYPGFAHLSNTPFGTAAPWYGETPGRITSLRRSRRFVGRVEYGVRWKLWCPEREVNASFPSEYREVVQTMLRGLKSETSVLSTLDYDVLMYIFNKFVGWDWFGKTFDAAKQRPSLVESSGSKRVDWMLSLLYEDAYEAAKGIIVNDMHSYRAMVRETLSRAIGIVKTIISQSIDIKRSLHACELEFRIGACLHLIKECCAYAGTAYENYRKPDDIGARAHPERIAHDVAIIQNVTDRLGLHLANRLDWEQLRNPQSQNVELEQDLEDDNVDQWKVTIEQYRAALDRFLDSRRDNFVLDFLNLAPSKWAIPLGSDSDSDFGDYIIEEAAGESDEDDYESDEEDYYYDEFAAHRGT